MLLLWSQWKDTIHGQGQIKEMYLDVNFILTILSHPYPPEPMSGRRDLSQLSAFELLSRRGTRGVVVSTSVR